MKYSMRTLLGVVEQARAEMPLPARLPLEGYAICQSGLNFLLTGAAEYRFVHS